MKIAKCTGCSRHIHIYVKDDGLCPFCKKMLPSDGGVNVQFAEPLSHLNESIEKIDDAISLSQYGNALSEIDNTLEWAPSNSEIYWRKLLAVRQCKTDKELLKTGNITSASAFECAEKYADEQQKNVYLLIRRTEDQFTQLLFKTLSEHELDKKRNTCVETTVDEYNNKFNLIEKKLKENITRLEDVEKSLHEYTIDCTAIAEEFKSSIEHLLESTDIISKKHRKEILFEEKNAWTSKLKFLSEQSNTEYNQLIQLTSTQPQFFEYSRLQNMQKSIIKEITQSISEIITMHNNLENLKMEIDKLAKEYDEAKMALHNGDYTKTIFLLSQELFDQILTEAMSVE